jgi:phytanoyl-CoA hydroxylase
MFDNRFSAMWIPLGSKALVLEVRPMIAHDDVAVSERFETAGYVVLEGFTSDEARAALRGRALEIVDAFEPAGASVFTTRRDAVARDAYFQESAETVRCFFEEEAFDEHGALRAPKPLSINKIGHAMHDLDPVFARFSRDPRLDDLVRVLGIAEPRIYQSMYIFKQPHIGGEVHWHQDASFFSTSPQSVITLWFALEAANRENGCLWVQPGGHRGPLREQFVSENGATRMVHLDGTPWPTEGEAVPVEVEAGALVVLNGLLPHYSAPNRSAHSRHAYTLHVVDGAATYDPRNWLQRRPGFPPRGFR